MSYITVEQQRAHDDARGAAAGEGGYESDEDRRAARAWLDQHLSDLMRRGTEQVTS